MVGEVDDDVEQTRYEVVVPHDVTCYGWDGKELEGEIFDGSLRLSIDKEIGVHDTWIQGGKMAPWKSFSGAIE